MMPPLARPADRRLYFGSRRIRQATFAELDYFTTAARAPRLRPYMQFVPEEIVIPEGKYEGRRLRWPRQPYARLFFGALDTGLFRRVAAAGCVQSGKSMHAYVIPIVYHLFEIKEPVVCGIPTMNLSSDKWRLEIKPVIEKSRFADQLPTTGRGSRGGDVESITFRNGATLRFMSAKGGDEKRSSFTTRVVSCTEVDKMDTAGEASRETDPVSQIENRAGSFDLDDRVTYLECTVSYTTGRIWHEYINGTQSRIACPCPHCGENVTPEREHLRGWQETDTVRQAEREAYFVCPECETRLTAEQRYEMNQRAKLVHKGQSIDPAGVITGEMPDTDTLGFRWNAFNNLFWSPGTIGAKEREAVGASDEEAKEKELLQFYWATPWEADDVRLSGVKFDKLVKRTAVYTEGVCPPDTLYATVGVDLGKWLAHFVVIAWRSCLRSQIVDYGVMEFDADKLGETRATIIGLREVKDLLEAGFAKQDGGVIVPECVWIDAGWSKTRAALAAFCRENKPAGARLVGRYVPALGFGSGQRAGEYYRAPQKKTNQVRVLGNGFHFARDGKYKQLFAHVDANSWKSEVHDALSMELDVEGAMVLYHAETGAHTKFSKHITAEEPVEEQQPGRPPKIIWKRLRKRNHYFDSTYLATAAGEFVAVQRAKASSTSPSGTPGKWFANQRRAGP